MFYPQVFCFFAAFNPWSSSIFACRVTLATGPASKYGVFPPIFCADVVSLSCAAVEQSHACSCCCALASLFFPQVQLPLWLEEAPPYRGLQRLPDEALPVDIASEVSACCGKVRPEVETPIYCLLRYRLAPWNSYRTCPSEDFCVCLTCLRLPSPLTLTRSMFLGHSTCSL